MKKENKYLFYLKNIIVIIISLIFIIEWILKILGYPQFFWGNRGMGYFYFASLIDPSINIIFFIIGQIIAIAFVFLFLYFFKNSNNHSFKIKFISDVVKVIGIFLILNLIFIISLKIIGFPLKPYELNRPEFPFFLGAIGIIFVCIIIGLIYLYKIIFKKM